jgi:hypothetical protein
VTRLGSQNPKGFRALKDMNSPYSHEIHRYNWTGQRGDDVYDQNQNWVEESTMHGTSDWLESHQIPLQANISEQEWDPASMPEVGYNYSCPSVYSASQPGRATTHSLSGARDDRSQVFRDFPRTTFTPEEGYRIQGSNLR